MKIFAQTFTLDPQTPIETISVAYQHGFQGVEITCEYPRGPLSYTQETIWQLRTLAKKYDVPLQVHAPYNNVKLADLNPRIQEASIQSVKDGIDFASQIDARIVTVHLGSASKGRLEHAYVSVRKVLLNSVTTLIGYAEERNITLAIENVQSEGKSSWEVSIGKSAEEIIDILKEIKAENLRVTFDVGHANTVCDPIDFAMKLAPHIVNVHLHDNDGSDDQHLVLGEGKIDFLKILRILEDIRYDGPLVLEYFNPVSLIKAKAELLNLLKIIK